MNANYSVNYILISFPLQISNPEIHCKYKDKSTQYDISHYLRTKSTNQHNIIFLTILPGWLWIIEENEMNNP